MLRGDLRAQEDAQRVLQSQVQQGAQRIDELEVQLKQLYQLYTKERSHRQQLERQVNAMQPEQEQQTQLLVAWQRKLHDVSKQLEQRVARFEHSEVEATVHRLVGDVEKGALEAEMKEAHEAVEEMKSMWQAMQDDVAVVMKHWQSEQAQVDAFSALEVQVLNDKLRNLESVVAGTEEREARDVDRLMMMESELEQWQQRYKIVHAEALQGATHRQTIATQLSVEQTIHKALATQLQQLQAQYEKMESIHAQKMMAHEDTTRHLQEEIETQRLEMEALHEKLQHMRSSDEFQQLQSELANVREAHAQQQRLHDEEQAKREQVERQLQDKEANLIALKEKLSKEQAEEARLKSSHHMLPLAEWNRIEEERTALGRKAERLRVELEHRRRQIESLQQAAEAPKQPQSSISSQTGMHQASALLDPDCIAQVVVEKKALEVFIRQYYAVAEQKCAAYKQQVATLEAACESLQATTAESCALLRMCAQLESCDELVRQTLMEVVTNLRSDIVPTSVESR